MPDIQGRYYDHVAVYDGVEFLTGVYREHYRTGGCDWYMEGTYAQTETTVTTTPGSAVTTCDAQCISDGYASCQAFFDSGSYLGTTQTTHTYSVLSTTEIQFDGVSQLTFERR